MILLDQAKERRIKRANTDWWINEKAMVGNNGRTYIAYVTDMGEVHVKELDAKCSKTPSRDVCICRLNCNYADEHNAPSLCVMADGRIIVAYTGHAQTHALKYRVTARPFDLLSFGPEHTLAYEQSVTYAQLFENEKQGQLWLFTRVNSVTWEFRYSADAGESWSAPNKFLISDAGGLFYFDARKQYAATENGVEEQWVFALYGHPRISRDHTIRSGIFDADGWLLTMDGQRTDVNLYGEAEGRKTETLLTLTDLATVYEAPAGATVRLLEVAPTRPLRVGLAAFQMLKPDTITYYAATWRNGQWHLSQPIAKAGAFLAPSQTDGSQTYVPGMAYYYGVGEEGLCWLHGGDSDTNRLFIARETQGDWLLESYVSRDCGESYQLEQEIRRLPAADGRKIWRPIVPIHAQDNLQVYWHEGTYSAHTGGWHCDTAMLVEYDD